MPNDFTTRAGGKSRRSVQSRNEVTYVYKGQDVPVPNRRLDRQGAKMAIINVNLNDVEDQSGEVHPEGEALMRIVDSELRDNKAGDAQYVNWRLKVLNTENNRPVYLITSLKPSALWNLKNLLRACGKEEFPSELDTSEFHGCEFYGQVKTEIYEDQKRNTVSGPYKRATA